MKQLLTVCALVLATLSVAGAGCAGDPNVEGAKLNLRNRDYAAAMTNVDAALAKNPNNAAALEIKGQILVQQAGASTDPAESLRLSRAAADTYRRLATADPSKAASSNAAVALIYTRIFNAGIQAFQRGQTDASAYTSAATYFEGAANLYPDSTAASLYQGYALYNAGRRADAIAPIQRAIDAGTTETNAYFTVSGYLQSQAQNATDPAQKAALFGQSVTVLERAATAIPGNGDVQTQLLSAYVLAGQTDRALASYASRVQAEPDNALFHYNYGALLLEADRYDEAIAQLREAVRLAPDNANAQYNLGAAHINQAVALSDEIRTMDDNLRAQRASLSADARTQRQAAIDALTARRRTLFQAAADPLMRARELQVAAGQEPRDACRALFQVLVNINQRQQAEQYRACAGL